MEVVEHRLSLMTTINDKGVKKLMTWQAWLGCLGIGRPFIVGVCIRALVVPNDPFCGHLWLDREPIHLVAC